MRFQDILESLLTFYFPDDFNKLCPHGSGLLPVSSTHIAGEQHPYIGTCSHAHILKLLHLLFIQKVSFADFISFSLMLWLSLSPQMQMNVRCLDQKSVRMDSVQISFRRTLATVAVASTMTTSGSSVWVRKSSKVIVFREMKPCEWLNCRFALEGRISHELHCCVSFCTTSIQHCQRVCPFSNPPIDSEIIDRWIWLNMSCKALQRLPVFSSH